MNMRLHGRMRMNYYESKRRRLRQQSRRYRNSKGVVHIWRNRYVTGMLKENVFVPYAQPVRQILLERVQNWSAYKKAIKTN